MRTNRNELEHIMIYFVINYHLNVRSRESIEDKMKLTCISNTSSTLNYALQTCSTRTANVISDLVIFESVGCCGMTLPIVFNPFGVLIMTSHTLL